MITDVDMERNMERGIEQIWSRWENEDRNRNYMIVERKWVVSLLDIVDSFTICELIRVDDFTT